MDDWKDGSRGLVIIALIAMIHISTVPATHLRAFPTPKNV